MFGLPGLHELVWLMLIIAVLSLSGLWPRIIRGLRELRGDIPPESSAAPRNADLDMCYRLLGVSPTATWDEVERAFRSKAKIHHPDRGGDEDTMRALNEAFTLIKKARNRTPNRR